MQVLTNSNYIVAPRKCNNPKRIPKTINATERLHRPCSIYVSVTPLVIPIGLVLSSRAIQTSYRFASNVH